MAIRHLHDLSVVGNVTVATTGVTNNVLLTSTDTSAASAPDLVLYRNALIADSDTLGVLEFQGRNGMVTSSTAPLTYGAIYGRVFDASENHTGLGISANKGNGSGAFVDAMNVTLKGTNNSAEGAVIINPSTTFELPDSNLEVKGSYGITTESHGSSANWKQAYDNHITGVAVTGTSTKTITLTQRDGGTISANFSDQSGSGGIDMTNGSNNRVVTAVDSDTVNGEAGLLFGGSYLEITPGNIATPLQVKRTSASTRQVNLLLSANDGTTTSEGFLGIDSGADLRYGASSNTSTNSLVLTEDNLDFVVSSSTNNAIVRLAGGGTNFANFNIGGLAGAITVNSSSNSITIGHHDTSSSSSVNNSNGTVIQDVTLDTYGHVTALGSVNLDSRYYTESESNTLFVNVSGDTMSGNLSMNSNNITDIDLLSLGQNTVGTTFGDGVSSAPDHMISQQVGDNDGWRLYGEAPSTNDVKMIFEIVDDIESGDTWVFRNKKTYSPYTARDEFKIAGDGKFYSRGNGYVNTNQRVFADNYHPNADKWTTARSHTVTLTGEVTGTATQSVDGTGNKTWSIATTLNNTALDDQYVDVTGDTMTGKLTLSDSGYEIGDEMMVWKKHYVVNSTNPGELLYSDGNSLPNGGIYRFTAHISGTGTDQFARAVYWNQNGTWRVNVTGQSGTSSNHPEFQILSNGTSNVPHVHIDHASNYTIQVLGERIGLTEGTGTDNAGYGFGVDGFMGSVHSDLYFLPGGTTATGADPYNDGNKVFHDGYHPNADKLTTARTIAGTSFDGTSNIDINYNNLTNKPSIPTVNNGTLTVQGTGALGGSGTFTANQSTNATISISHDDTSSQSSVNNSSGTVIQDVTLDGYGHVTSLGSVDLDGRYYTESEIQTFFNRGYISKHSAVNLPVGWYTIATNTGDRALGEFQIWDGASGDHQSVLFNASHHFGTNGSNDINVLANSRYSGTNFRYIRIKDNGTYDGAALQVYVDGASNSVNVAIVGGNAQESGWVIKDWIADATDPGDVSSWANFTEHCRVDLDNVVNGGMISTGEMYLGGTTTQYKAFHDNYHPNADKWTTARTLSLTGDVTGSVSWDGSANASITTAVANNSHEHTKLHEESTITYGGSYLQWTDLSGNGGAGTNGNAPGNPFSDWHHHLIMNHGNSSGYYVDMAFSFHSDRVHFRRLENGSFGSWREFFHTGHLPTWSEIASKPSTFAPSSHNHDDRYYTESESDAKYLLNTSDVLNGELNVARNSGVTGSSAPSYSSANIELQTSSNHVPAISFHRGGYSASTLYEYDGELYVNPWTTRAQAGKLLSSGNFDDYVTSTYINNLVTTSGISQSDADTRYINATGDTMSGTLNMAGNILYLHTSSGSPGLRSYYGTVNVINGSSAGTLYVGTGSANSSGAVYAVTQGASSNNKVVYNNTYHSYYVGSSTEEMRLESDGDLHVEGDVTAYSTTVSDIRLKDNVITIGNALDKVCKLRGVEYTWNKGSRKDTRDLGVIAQEVEKVLPEIVKEKKMPLIDDSGTTYKAVDYEKITAVLIEAVKEQQAQIDELTTILEEVTKQLNNGNNI